MARQLAGEAYLRMGMRDASYFKKAEDAVTPIITGGKYELISARYGKYAAELVIIIMICSVGESASFTGEYGGYLDFRNGV